MPILMTTAAAFTYIAGLQVPTYLSQREVALFSGEGRPGLCRADGGPHPGLRRMASFSPDLWGLVPSRWEVLLLCPILACFPLTL